MEKVENKIKQIKKKQEESRREVICYTPYDTTPPYYTMRRLGPLHSPPTLCLPSRHRTPRTATPYRLITPHAACLGSRPHLAASLHFTAERPHSLTHSPSPRQCDSILTNLLGHDLPTD